DGVVKLWDLAGFTEQALLLGPGGGVRSLAFSADGSTLAAAGGQGAVILWDVASRQEQVTFSRHGKMATGVAFTPDRQLVTVGWDRNVKFWDLNPATWIPAPVKIKPKK